MDGHIGFHVKVLRLDAAALAGSFGSRSNNCGRLLGEL
jgi:hypothetical protein